jgi:cytidine deaminase
VYADLPENWEALSFTAWRVRDNAIAARTKVGAAVLARRPNGSQAIFGGCNIEDLWKASSIHAERTAIACMVAGGGKKAEKLLVAAERERFTPCGNCMDFLMQFGGPDMQIAFQPKPSYEVQVFTAAELMPHYPR